MLEALVNPSYHQFCSCISQFSSIVLPSMWDAITQPLQIISKWILHLNLKWKVQNFQIILEKIGLSDLVTCLCLGGVSPIMMYRERKSIILWNHEYVCGGSLCERVASGPQNPTLCWQVAEIISPNCTANIFNCLLELPCVRFVQHYLISLLLNLYTSFENRTHCFTLPRDLLLNWAQIYSKPG